MNDYPEFYKSVWDAVRRIPKGKVATYAQIARMIGKPNAARAVGNALRHNPFAPKVPCHRVVKSDGSLGGFNGKMDGNRKEKMLRAEGIDIRDGRIDLNEFGLKA